MTSGRLEKETKEFAKVENKLKSLPTIFTEYYYTLRAEKKSYKTIEDYINSVITFMKFVTNGNDDESFYKNVTTMDVNKYMISLETRVVHGRTKSTTSGFRASRWKAVNSFFEFLVDTKNLETNPISKKSRPKITDNASVTYLTEDEIAGIIDNIEDKAKDSMVNRDKLLFMLGVTTGLRVAAIAQINIEDINLENNTIHVIEKMNKEFDVLISKKVKKVLVAWLNDRKKYFHNVDTDALFVSQFGQRISYDAIRKLLIKYAEGVTNKKITPHVMRHSCATAIYEKTGDIYLASAQLHHSNISTTMRYANMSNKKLKQAINIMDDLV